MNATFGTLLILVNLFLPGILFLRFYYSGEHSKQFHMRIPILQTALRAFIPGLIIQINTLSLFLYFTSAYTIIDINKIYFELIGNPTKYSSITTYFLKNQIQYLLYYTVGVCVFGIFIGHTCQYVIHGLSLDVRFKVLRFRNNWAYIFNGQYLKFNTFKKVHSEITLGNKHPQSHKRIMMTMVDALVMENEKSKLYSGFLFDYDISGTDNNSLERIYLADTKRYKFCGEEEIKADSKLKKFEPKEIPGDIFILETKNLVNLNITYIPAPYEEAKKEIKHGKRRKLFKGVNLILSLLTFIAILFLGVTLFIGWESCKMIEFIHKEFNLIEKCWIIINAISLWSILFYDAETKKKDKKLFKSTLIGVVIVSIPTILFSLYEVFA